MPFERLDDINMKSIRYICQSNQGLFVVMLGSELVIE